VVANDAITTVVQGMISGLWLSFATCQVTSVCEDTLRSTLNSFQQTTSQAAPLLGALLNTVQALTNSLVVRCADLARVVDRNLFRRTTPKCC
jgi:hypothetical protein